MPFHGQEKSNKIACHLVIRILLDSLIQKKIRRAGKGLFLEASLAKQVSFICGVGSHLFLKLFFLPAFHSTLNSIDSSLFHCPLASTVN